MKRNCMFLNPSQPIYSNYYFVLPETDAGLGIAARSLIKFIDITKSPKRINSTLLSGI